MDITGGILISGVLKEQRIETSCDGDSGGICRNGGMGETASIMLLEKLGKGDVDRYEFERTV